MNETTLQTFLDSLITMAVDVAGKLLASILVLIIGKLLVKLILKLVKKSRLMKKAEPTVAHFLINFIKIGLYAILAVTVIAIMGIPMASIVAAIASAGVAIGLAMQGSLSNLAGGIMILIFKPFKIDDYITAGDESGTVVDIGIFYTVLKTPDNRQIMIPNGKVMGDSVTNVSVYDTRRLDLSFGVAYGSDVEKVKAVLLDEAKKHALVLQDPEPFCRMTAQGDSSLDFALRVWTKAGDYWTVNFDLLESINARFEAEGINIPFQTLDVNISNK